MTCKDNYYAKESTQAVRRLDDVPENTELTSSSFLPCDVILKRVDYIEDAVSKGFRSIMLNHEDSEIRFIE